MLSFLGLGHNVDIRIVLHDEDTRKHEELKSEDGQVAHFPIYYDGETVSGQVLLGLKRGSKLEHQGIRIELLGCIEFNTDRNSREDFVALTQDLARPGILSQPTAYPFEFTNVSKPYETYRGTHVRLRYFLRVTIQRRLTDLTKEREMTVHTLAHCVDCDEGIRMEVGIEDCLHIEFQYNKSKYHLHDVIVGKIYFLLVRVKIKNMEIQIVKRETLGSGSTMFGDSETVAKYEIMDGAPVRGESIPLRLFLQSYPLGSTIRNEKKKFSVRYFINLVLLDEEDRRYYKQQEIILYRRADKRWKSPASRQVTVHPTASISPNGDAFSQESANGVSPDLNPENPSADLSESASDTIVYPKETSQASPNGAVVSEVEGQIDNESNASGSPDTSRASRSMCRYDPKPREPDSNATSFATPATLEVDIPPSKQSSPATSEHQEDGDSDEASTTPHPAQSVTLPSSSEES